MTRGVMRFDDTQAAVEAARSSRTKTRRRLKKDQIWRGKTYVEIPSGLTVDEAVDKLLDETNARWSWELREGEDGSFIWLDVTYHAKGANADDPFKALTRRLFPGCRVLIDTDSVEKL